MGEVRESKENMAEEKTPLTGAGPIFQLYSPAPGVQTFETGKTTWYTGIENPRLSAFF